MKNLPSIKHLICTLAILIAYHVPSFAQVDKAIGTGTTTNTTTGMPAVFYDYYEGDRQQYLYLASELTAAGMGSGYIYAIKWNVSAVNTCNAVGWTLSMGTTTSANLSSGWLSTPTTVFGPVSGSYVPVSGINTYTLTTPYYWDGVSNIVVQVCHGTGSACRGYTTNAQTAYTTTSFISCRYYNADCVGSLCGTTSTGTTTTNRPNIIFRWGSSAMNNASVASLVNPGSQFCGGTIAVQVQLKNNGKNRINGVRLYWELDGIPQPYITYSTMIDTNGSAAGNSANVTLGNVLFDNVAHTIKAYTSLPNGVADTVNYDDTMVFERRSSPLARITTTGQTVYCGGGAVSTMLNATTGTGYSYQWRLNGNNIPGANGTTYTATSAGDFTIRVDSGSCFNVSPILRIDNLAMPQPSITPESYAVFCDRDSLTLNANAGISGATYQWLLQGIAIPGATNASYVAKMPGNYIVKTTKFNCTVSSPGTNVSQVPAPTPTITKNINVLTTGGSYVAYQWYVDGNILPGDTFATCIAKVAGAYTVKVSNGGCEATASGVDITASEAATSVNSLGYSNAIRIYPNPVTSTVHIASPIAVKATISSVDGKVLLQSNGSTEMDMSSFASGMYIIRITDIDGNLLKMDKLVKAAH